MVVLLLLLIAAVGVVDFGSCAAWCNNTRPSSSLVKRARVAPSFSPSVLPPCKIVLLLLLSLLSLIGCTALTTKASRLISPPVPSKACGLGGKCPPRSPPPLLLVLLLLLLPLRLGLTTLVRPTSLYAIYVHVVVVIVAAGGAAGSSPAPVAAAAATILLSAPKERGALNMAKTPGLAQPKT